MTSSANSVALAERISSEEFRRVLGYFASGVTIISGFYAGEPVGFACQSFSALSIDPPLVSFSVARTSTTWPRIESSGSFCVSILSAEQEKTCRAFAVSGADKFAGVKWTPGPATGSPALTGSLAQIDCEIEAVHPGGDHAIVVGRVRAFQAPETDADPLLFYRSAFSRSVA
ncbi:flavin reductase family protein [Streptomyces agglomeratus]|uniref:flavin reductase family protein n=1 Tax=Streptomyces agglomeratus TaxID=285458 RepID=UPI000853F2D8|nr:flavin reductase family protein [Streptomyces agglomeratus]OEJ36247.1 NADPH-flavin oxidoreductase [Streptomyces agglomeratus]